MWAAMILKAGCELRVAPGVPDFCGASLSELLDSLRSFAFDGALIGHVHFGGNFFHDEDDEFNASAMCVTLVLLVSALRARAQMRADNMRCATRS